MTTDPTHPDTAHTPHPAPDPMSDGEPMGASDRVESLPGAPAGRPETLADVLATGGVVSVDPAGGRAQAFRVGDSGCVQHLGELDDDGIVRRPLAEPLIIDDPTPCPGPWADAELRARAAAWWGETGTGVDFYSPTPAPAYPSPDEFQRRLQGEHVNCSHDSMGQDPLKAMICSPADPPRCAKHAEGCTRAPLRGMRHCWQHTSPGLRALREANDRIVERDRVLNRLDIPLWRRPVNGLLEYDPVHDEWRVEVFAGPADPFIPDGRRIILRKHAGRRRYAAGGMVPPAGSIDLSPYLAGDGTARAYFRPFVSTPASAPSPDELQDWLHALPAGHELQVLQPWVDPVDGSLRYGPNEPERDGTADEFRARWVTFAEELARHRGDPRMPMATRPRDWPHHVDESGQVVSFKTGDTYQAAELIAGLAASAVPVGQALARLLRAAAELSPALRAKLEAGRRGHRA